MEIVTIVACLEFLGVTHGRVEIKVILDYTAAAAAAFLRCNLAFSSLYSQKRCGDY